MEIQDRKELGRNRLKKVLRSHGIAVMRTLENKISDGGPGPMRVDPHALTNCRQQLQQGGLVKYKNRGGTLWYYLTGTSDDVLERRLAEQEPIHNALQRQHLTRRIGQALEIAIYRALCAQNTLEHQGYFSDLEEHDDSEPYSKHDPLNALSGNVIPGNLKLDFLVREPTSGWAGIEAKNLREWIYPDSPEVKDLLYKACCLDVVPVLIARRIAYVTRHVLRPYGLLTHETFNQRLPESEAELASRAKDKTLLGYHDIRLGNEPILTHPNGQEDRRLLDFINENLPSVLPEARERFHANKERLCEYANGAITYAEFTGSDEPEPDYESWAEF